MKLLHNLNTGLKSINNMITRYPLTTIFLLVATVINSIQINKVSEDYFKYLFTLVVGALLSIVVQAIYEQFFQKSMSRFILMGVSCLLTIGYYLILMPLSTLSIEVGVRTWVAIFALLILFVLVPSIKSRISFNECFMATFKAIFIAAFFSGIIYLGISIILATTNLLLISLNGKYYLHFANIIFVLFAPMYFLSQRSNACSPCSPRRRGRWSRYRTRSGWGWCRRRRSGAPSAMRRGGSISASRQQPTASSSWRPGCPSA